MAALADELHSAVDPVHFAATLGFTPDPWQARVLRWPGKRLLLNCNRQSGKSTTTAIVALHRAMYYPGSLVLLVSPSLRQSGELFRKCSDFLTRLDVQPSLTEDNRLSCTLANGSRIVSLPSTEATIRGFSGANLIVEDESARVSDELYFATRPMLAVSGGRMILMSTPFGQRGHFFEEWTQGGDAWERVQIKATECPRISPDFLAEERRSMGDWWYRQEYLCQFVETVDQIFSYDLIMAAISAEVKPLWEVANSG
jgi:hypothetical protein